MGVKSWTNDFSATAYVNIADTQTVICNPSAGSSVTWTPPVVSIAANDSYWSGTKSYTLKRCFLSLSPSEGYQLFSNATNYVAKGVYSNAVGWTSGLSYTIASLFNSSNPTTKIVSATFYVPADDGFVEAVSPGETFGQSIYPSSTITLTTVNFTLNAPPDFNATQVSVDTPYIYSGLTTASVTVSNSSAQCGGTVSDITLTIGNQTASRSSDGTLSILLDTVGTFTPTVTVTDSRGQTTTKSLDPITVNGYVAPSVAFEVERTLATGVADDEGTYAVIDATLTFADVIATAQAPTVTVTDQNGTTTTATVTWYSTRATDGTLSGTVTWSNLSSGDTVYGLVSGFDTQYSYQISVTPADNIQSGTAITQTISSAFYTIDFLAGGHGIAFGQPASQTGFYCNMDTHLLQGVDITGNANITGNATTADMTQQEIDDFVNSLVIGR